MQTLHELVRDLVDAYTAKDDHGRLVGEPGPGLIARLDSIALRTSQPAQTGGRSAPGSRPPTSLEAVHWSQRIKTEAVALDMELRGSDHPQVWYRALRAIPPGAEAAARHGDAARLVGMWHGTVLTVLGLRSPSVHFAHVRCLVCGQRTVYGRADDDRPRAWCINDACEDDDTGRPARCEGDRL